ncbi:MAG: hypothetical protein JNM57_10750 [Cyclobacteriaceae bacterium]|nr:hypothetical protein [Cyclobacteriaceae bacterium]
MQSNIKYELLDYERLIDSVSTELQQIPRAQFGIDLSEEADRIKQTFIHEVFSFQDERHLERYIQYHQQALISLMDETLKITSDTTSTQKELYQLCYDGLEDMLSFIERHFAKYFDQDAKAPTAYVAIVQNDMRHHFQDITQKLADLSADQRLTDSVVYALRKLTESDASKEVSYRKILFAKQVQKELSELLERIRGESDINEDLRNLVYYLNYNSIKAFTYHTNYIDVLLNETDSRNDMIERLSFILKRIKQAQVKPGIAYNHQAPPLKVQLNSYIIEEIEHLQRVHQLGLTSPGKPSDLMTTFRIQIEMSVAQIAYFLKVLVESKVIVNQNVTELLRFLSKILVSKKVEIISYDSLRSKYYNIEQSTRDSIRNILLRMINSIDRGI